MDITMNNELDIVNRKKNMNKLIQPANCTITYTTTILTSISITL